MLTCVGWEREGERGWKRREGEGAWREGLRERGGEGEEGEKRRSGHAEERNSCSIKSSTRWYLIGQCFKHLHGNWFVQRFIFIWTKDLGKVPAIELKVQRSTHARTHTHAHTHTHTHTHTHAHTHARTHARTHTHTLWQKPSKAEIGICHSQWTTCT